MARKPLIAPGSMLSSGDVPDLQSRIIAKDAEKHGRAPVQNAVVPSAAEASIDSDSNAEYNQYDKSYDNMTSLSYDKQSGNTSGKTDIRQSILQSVRQGGQVVEQLKTVTIKLAPSLDRKVEQHMFETGRKKQDVVRDALLLYFDAIESAQDGDEGDD